jgi:hypothetical protein
MKKAGTKQNFCTAFHLQINGQTERVNEILNQYLCSYIVDDHKDWNNYLCLVEFCYNSTKHSTTKNEPLQIALGSWSKTTHDLTILKTRDACRESGKEAKEMAKKHEKKKAQPIKLLENVQASYEN